MTLGLSDDELANALKVAADRISNDLAAGTAVSEDRLRLHLCDALAGVTEAVVERERHVEVPGFQGVGPVDVVVLDKALSVPVGLIECKWSTSITRDKIFEGAWDAVKLALALPTAATRWLVTGAPSASWAATETPDLFVTGEIDVRELWDRQLEVPGPNGGLTVGRDCEAGGRGNFFTHAPERLTVVAVADEPVQGMNIRLRAAQILPGPGPLVRFHDDPEFPREIRDGWLGDHVPTMADDQFGRLLARLRLKRWTDGEIAEKVLPHREGRS